MQNRELGRTGWKVSTVSFGAWAIGGSWDNVDDKDSLVALHRSIDLGVNFIDTADVYGAKNPAQAEDNVRAADLPSLSPEAMEKIRGVYDSHIRSLVHNYW